MRSRRSRAALVVLVVAVSALGACGGSGSEPEVEREKPIPVPKSLAKPGTEIADDLVVPGGASLAGAAFPTPSQGLGVDNWSAYLVIDGDPFKVWDDLSLQVRAQTSGLLLSGSEDACIWILADGADGADASGDGATTTEPVPQDTAGSTTTTAVGAASPPATDLESLTITDVRPAEEVEGIECSATAPALVGGNAKQVSMHLRSGKDRPATLTIEVTWGDEDMKTEPAALRTTLEMQASPGGQTIRPGTDTVPEVARLFLPEPKAQPTYQELGPFGPKVNCFAKAKEGRLLLPPGGNFVAGGFDDGQTSVLRVLSDDAAMAEFRKQTVGDNAATNDDGRIQPRLLTDGTEVMEWSYAAEGGGSCRATSSENGTYIAVTSASS